MSFAPGTVDMPGQDPFQIGLMCQDIDTTFANALHWVLYSPYADTGLEVRPKWDDGTPAHTRKAFGYCAMYHNVGAPNSFPLLGLRKTYWKGAYDEILWIYQKASNRLKDLNTHIWDAWDVGNGTIGKAYGYQIAKKTQYKEGLFNQMEKVIYDLRHNPTSRAIMTQMYNVEDLPEMGLRPCCYSMTFNVEYVEGVGYGEDNGKLNAILNQRSWDMVTAGGWNIAQYALLLAMVAHVTGHRAGTLMHVVADAHIYDRHTEIAEQMVANLNERPRYGNGNNQCIMPTLKIDPDVKEFSDFGPDSIQIEGYQPCDYNPKIPVAV